MLQLVNEAPIFEIWPREIIYPRWKYITQNVRVDWRVHNSEFFAYKEGNSLSLFFLASKRCTSHANFRFPRDEAISKYSPCDVAPYIYTMIYHLTSRQLSFLEWMRVRAKEGNGQMECERVYFWASPAYVWYLKQLERTACICYNFQAVLITAFQCSL